MKTPEFWEKKTIREYLDKIGAWHFVPYTAGYGASGIPDIVGCYKTKFFSVEVKRPGCVPTVIQNRRMGEIRGNGGAAFAGDAETVIPQLERWKNAVP
jgi:hypothetical protein